MTRKKILIVDDDVDFVRINRAVLERAGYEVVAGFTGAEGLTKAREEKPDLILLDFMMETTTTGAPVAQGLRKEPETKDIPLILCTAVHRIKPWWKDIKPDQDWLPVDKVLEKPISPEILLAEVSHALPA